jgi:arylsulfate sulfotransferase
MCIIFPASGLPSVSLPPNVQTEIREIDLAGNLIRHLTMQDLNARLAAANFNVTLQLFHHDFALLPNGHILVLANTLRSFNDLPGYPGTTVVLGDVVVDLDPNFNPVWLWNEFDHFDVNRHPMQFADWTHSNTVTYSPMTGIFWFPSGTRTGL